MPTVNYVKGWEMKLTVLGVKRIQGKAKATGNDFDMCRLFAMVPIEQGGGRGATVTGYGFELAEMNLEPKAMEQFANQKLPATLELTTDSRPFRGRLETVVTGFVAAVSRTGTGG